MESNGMKIWHVSDTHSLHDVLEAPEVDVMIHSGDALGRSTEEELHAFIRWMSGIEIETKIFVPGNHDCPIEGNEDEWSEIFLEAGIDLLVDEGLYVDNVLFYGMPWMPNFYDWSYMLEPGGEELEAKVADIHRKTEVLITHCPPKGRLDMNQYDDRCGCELLAKRIEVVKPVLHCFGHIHFSAGVDGLYGGDTVYSNGAVLGENYRPRRRGNIFELTDGVATHIGHGKFQTD